MALSFPNLSRSFNPASGDIRFWGHDGALEAAFLIGQEALRGTQPEMPSDENSVLKAFDGNLALIHAAAARVYKRGRRGLYEVTASDFIRR